jgi:multicomponent Na+:H+ antiporter subunit E
MRSSVGFALVLVAIWVLAWGSLSWANVASGVLVAVGLLVAVPDVRHPSHMPVVRPVPLARLGVRLLRDLAMSNVLLAREVLAPRPRISTGIVRVPLAGCSDELLTLIANLVAMTPGTMPIEVERNPAVMYVHVLNLGSVEEVRHDIWRLRDLVVHALGSAEAIAALERETSRP